MHQRTSEAQVDRVLTVFLPHTVAAVLSLLRSRAGWIAIRLRVHAFGSAVPFGGVIQAGLLWRIWEPQLHQDPPAEIRLLNCAGESRGSRFPFDLLGSTGAATRIEYDLVDNSRPIQLERRAPVYGGVRIVGDEQQADLAPHLNWLRLSMCGSGSILAASPLRWMRSAPRRWTVPLSRHSTLAM